MLYTRGMRGLSKLFCLFSVLLFACALIFVNEIAPLVGDDYVYSFVYDALYYLDASFSQRLSGLKDIWDSQLAHYQSWSGRFAAHTLAQFFLLYGSGLIWSIANSLCLLGCVYLMLQVSGAKWRGRWDAYLLVLCLYWSFLPSPGHTHFWLTGSCNYQWALLFVLVFLYMWKHLPCHTVFAWFIYPIALLAGNFQEALSPGIALCLLFYAAFNRKKTSLHQWCALVVFMAGIAMNLLAPGNQIRQELHGLSGGLLNGMVRIALGTGELFRDFIQAPAKWTVPSVALFCFLFQLRKKQYHWNMFFAAAAWVSLMAAIYANYINSRSAFGTFCYSYISIIPLLLNAYNHLRNRARALLMGVLLVYSSWLMCQAAYTLKKVDIHEQAVAKSASDGKGRVNLYAWMARGNPLWNVNCINWTRLLREKEGIHNRAFAAYYNIPEFGLAFEKCWEEIPDDLDRQFHTLPENEFVRINPDWVILRIRGGVTALQADLCHVPNDKLDIAHLFKRRAKGWVIRNEIPFHTLHKGASSFILVNCQSSPPGTPLEIRLKVLREHQRECLKFSLSDERGKCIPDGK